MMTVKDDRVEVYIYNEAKQGNHESGDMHYTFVNEDYFLCAIADGLGNGPVARESAAIVPEILAAHHDESIDQLLNRCNMHMHQKRGAAVAIIKADFKASTIQYSCVGNVRFYLYRQADDKMIYPLPVMGYLSGRPVKLRTQEYTYGHGDLFLLHSDGVDIRSPKAFMQKSAGPYDLYKQVLDTIEHGDDATYISGSLLRP
ncbi:PP2C family serine/threonine-protein phosphatase [Bhargavaea ullalensis]|uniref:Negative regulator of sigma-B (Phosphoserine phosphatase) n=2 Tax=Bhargavaea ullalensis TaxID=1265685 RepID=A0ABV2GCJ7_9BACL